MILRKIRKDIIPHLNPYSEVKILSFNKHFIIVYMFYTDVFQVLHKIGSSKGATEV